MDLHSLRSLKEAQLLPGSLPLQPSYLVIHSFTGQAPFHFTSQFCILPHQRLWLTSHLTQCPQCLNHAALFLFFFSFTVYFFLKWTCLFCSVRKAMIPKCSLLGSWPCYVYTGSVETLLSIPSTNWYEPVLQTLSSKIRILSSGKGHSVQMLFGAVFRRK